MALATTTRKTRRHLRTKEIYLNAVASGNYVANGDTLDLTKNVVPKDMSDGGFGYPGTIDIAEVVSSPPGYTANLVQGTNLTNWKLQVLETGAGLSAAFADLPVAAYPAAITGGVFVLRFEGPKLRL